MAECSFSILNMRSATARDEDLTARARIRDAAIARFAADGVDGTSLRVIAEDAGVSPALVIHHFGSKDSLRTACDEHVVATVRERKVAAMGRGPSMDPLAAMHEDDDDPPIMRYLARALIDGSPAVAGLVDGMVEVAVASVEEGVRSGLLEPTEQPRELATVLTLWSLGVLALHEHADRLLDIDLTDDPEGRGTYARTAMRALRGIFTDDAYRNMQRALSGADRRGDDDDV